MPLAPINIIAVVEFRRTHESEGSDPTREEFMLPHEYRKYHELIGHIARMGYLITSASIAYPAE